MLTKVNCDEKKLNYVIRTPEDDAQDKQQDEEWEYVNENKKHNEKKINIKEIVGKIIYF